MKNTDDLSLGAVKQLRRAFGKMRHRKFWKEKVKGGVACIEVTNIGNGWHPHLHAVIDCRFLSIKIPEPNRAWSRKEKAAQFQKAAEELGTLWAKLLGQELASIKIKRARRDTILKEVVKYSVKGTDLAECQGEIAPLIDAIEGTRLMTTFGTVFGIGAEVGKQIRDAALEPSNLGTEPDLEPGPCCQHPSLVPDCILDKAMGIFRTSA